MKPFIFFQFITNIAALARQLLMSTFFILSATAFSFGQNNSAQYANVQLDFSHLSTIETKATSVTDVTMNRKAILALAQSTQNNFAQSQQFTKARIDISHLAVLEDKAESVIDVNVDQRTLRMASKFFKDSDPKEKEIKDLIAGIEAITVKVFHFEKEGEYQASDYQQLKTQIDNNPNWIRLSSVRSKKKDMVNVEVSIMTDEQDNLLGVAIIAAEKENLAVINIIGRFDLAKIRDLSGKFSIPDLELEGLGIVKKKTKEKKEEEKKPDQS